MMFFDALYSSSCHWSRTETVCFFLNPPKLNLNERSFAHDTCWLQWRQMKLSFIYSMTSSNSTIVISWKAERKCCHFATVLRTCKNPRQRYVYTNTSCHFIVYLMARAHSHTCTVSEWVMDYSLTEAYKNTSLSSHPASWHTAHHKSPCQNHRKASSFLIACKWVCVAACGCLHHFPCAHKSYQCSS